MLTLIAVAKLDGASAEPMNIEEVHRPISNSRRAYAAILTRIEAGLAILSFGQDEEIKLKAGKMFNARLRADAAREELELARRKAASARPISTPNGPALSYRDYQYQKHGRYTDAVLTVRDRIENGTSTGFRIGVKTTQPLNGWILRVRGQDRVVSQGELIGKNDFASTIKEPFAPHFVLNLIVARDGMDSTDFMPVYNEEVIQNR
jgi:hypothetical protein